VVATSTSLARTKPLAPHPLVDEYAATLTLVESLEVTGATRSTLDAAVR
jgi:hypothetical protein